MFDYMNWHTRFNKWKRRVNAILLGKAGATTDDFPEWGFNNSFDVGDTPEEAAEAVLEETGVEL